MEKRKIPPEYKSIFKEKKSDITPQEEMENSMLTSCQYKNKIHQDTKRTFRRGKSHLA
jgi:hypothetical protein